MREYTYTYTGTTWNEVLSSSTDTNTVWYCVMNDIIEDLSYKNYSQKIESIEITFSDNYYGDWYLGIGYSDRDYWDWDYFTHMSPWGTGTSGEIGATTFLLSQENATAGTRNTVFFENIENDRTVIPPNQEVRFVIYTYTDPTSTWGINSGFSATINYKTDESSTSSASASISLKSKTTTSITFEAHFENCRLGISNYPLCYYYSTSSNSPNSSYDGETNNVINKWHRFSNINNDTVQHTITGLNANTTYYIWVAGAAEPEYTEDSTISIEIDNESKTYTYSETEITTNPYAEIEYIPQAYGEEIQIYPSFSYCNLEENSYYYYSTSSEITSNQISNNQQMNKWCLITNSIYISIYEGLTANTQYYIWIAAKPQTNYSPKNSITINSSTYVVKQTNCQSNNYSKCDKPNISINSLSAASVKIQWKYAKKGNFNPISGYEIRQSLTDGGTNNDTYYNVDSTDSYGSEIITGLTPETTYYFAIRTKGSPAAGSSYYSDYAWDSITLQSHPTVNSGDIIYKEDMDNLKTQMGLTAASVTQYNSILASEGNNYKPNSATQYTHITAQWFNNV